MVNPEFSETQFAFGITRELDDGHGPLRPVGIPFFPTRFEEKDLGFDVSWMSGIRPIFLQFKRSKKLTDARAMKEQWDFYQDPFYRFSVKTSSDSSDWNQHERLVALGDIFEDTYYVAPQFVEWSDYTKYSRSNSINQHSAFLKCKSAPTPFDNESHYICHRPQDAYGRWFSQSEDPPQIEFQNGLGELIGTIFERQPMAESFEEARSSFSEARHEMMESIEGEFNPEEYDSDQPLLWMREQQRFFFETMGTVLNFLIDSYSYSMKLESD